jgi:3-(3-hydroxy-phenyl)propionate hydroxylase
MSDQGVVVVGAGPVGMTAALALRAQELDVTVLEAGSYDRVRPGSRAIFIHRSTMELLEHVRPGLGREVNAHGLLWQTKRTFYRGRQLYAKTYLEADPHVLPAATSLPQTTMEQLLYPACLAAEVQFVWDSPVAGVETNAGGALVRLANGGSIDASYVIAADGARSDVRESLGIPLEGPRAENAFVIVDAAEDPADPMPLERVFHYEHPAVGGRNVLLVPFAGHWRIDLQCRPDDDPDDFSGTEGVKTWLPQVVDAKYAERVTWVSTYVFLQALARSFTDAERRVLLVGEAAHLFAPFGARGLNSGVPDAVVAAAAVRTAFDRRTTADAHAAIDHFAANRRAAAERNRSASNEALEHLSAASLSARAKRRVGALLATRVESVGRWLDSAPYGPRLGPPDSDGMQY